MWKYAASMVNQFIFDGSFIGGAISISNQVVTKTLILLPGRRRISLKPSDIISAAGYQYCRRTSLLPPVFNSFGVLGPVGHCLYQALIRCLALSL